MYIAYIFSPYAKTKERQTSDETQSLGLLLELDSLIYLITDNRNK